MSGMKTWIHLQEFGFVRVWMCVLKSSSSLRVLQAFLQLLILFLQFLDLHLHWFGAAAFKAQFIHDSLLGPLRRHVWSDVWT